MSITPSPQPAFTRVLGTYGRFGSGPLLVIIGGLHGNEPAGARAARRVLTVLNDLRPSIRGRVVALTGNLSALPRGVRFVDSDLNRIWARDEQRSTTAPTAETSERDELLEVIEATLTEHAETSASSAIILDLHSTSAHGSPFSIIGDTLQNRRIAFAFHVPVILGLEENVDGTLLDFFGSRGLTAVALEGGQHEEPSTELHHEAAIWMALVAGGLAGSEDVPNYEQHAARLRHAARGLPRVVEIRHRHAISSEAFRMRPGFTNFHPVQEGETLAETETGEVGAPMDGILLMPRYQGQGEDGFFLARRVRPMWLGVSALLRRLRLEKVLAWLPGVASRGRHGEILEVNTGVARWFSVQFFHLFGYRKCHPAEGRLVFTRRFETPPGR